MFVDANPRLLDLQGEQDACREIFRRIATSLERQD
jgi:hypothetical protein